jgi:hypothetical protein
MAVKQHGDPLDNTGSIDAKKTMMMKRERRKKRRTSGP